eukprot:130996-Rhodomonas_salina.2
MNPPSTASLGSATCWLNIAHRTAPPRQMARLTHACAPAPLLPPETHPIVLYRTHVSTCALKGSHV